MQPTIEKISASFSVLPKIRRKADRAELKEALRPCIDRLEELYRQIP